MDEYRSGDWVEPGDPADQARAKAAGETRRCRATARPASPNNEAWQREKQNIGQTADELGLPRTWRTNEPSRPKHDQPEGEQWAAG